MALTTRLQQSRLPVRQVPFRPCRHTLHAKRRSCVVHAQASSPTLFAVKNWASTCGVNTDKIDITTSIEDGTPFFVASKDIGSGETIFTVPDKVWITVDTVSKSSIGKAVAGLEPWIQLALFILAEKQNAKSEWKAYVAMMGKKDSVLFWDDAQLSSLEGTQILQNTLGYRAFFASKFEELKQTVFASNPALFPDSVFTEQEFMWAVVAVRSAVHAPLEGDKIALVPVADAVTHRRFPNSSWRLRSANLLSRSSGMAVEAVRNIRKGEEISMDYGLGKPDNAVLLDYGVMDTLSPKPGYMLTLTLEETDRFYDDKIDILQSAGLSTSYPFALEPARDPPENMMAMLRTMQLSGMDAFLLESIFRGEVWEQLCEPIAPPNEEAVCRAMINGAAMALAGYASNIDTDLQELRADVNEKGSREDLSVRVRLGEKESLDSIGAFFESRIDSMETLTYYQERRLRRLGLVDDDGRTTYDGFFKDGIA